MLARRREQIIVVLGLIGVNVLLGWALDRLWKDSAAVRSGSTSALPHSLRSTPLLPLLG